MDNPIKKFREENGFTRAKFARLIGTSSEHLRVAETKGVHTPENIVRKIGLIFNVNEGKMLPLLPGEGNPKTPDVPDEELSGAAGWNKRGG